MSEIAIDVQKREATGSGVSRKLRRAGVVPAIVYGGGKEPVPVQLDRRKLLEIFRSGVDRNALFLLKLEGTGQARHAMIREMVVDPITRRIDHIDFQRILLDQKVTVKVPIEVTGTAYGVKNEGGLVDMVTRELEVRCLPTAIPHSIVLDISPLHVGQHVEAKDLELPADVELHDAADRVILSVAHTRGEVALEAGAEVAEPAAEPQVIKRGKEKAEE